ncbi:MAG: AAA family ATPase [Hespellia sp.]|nr:AAA family ATPase [Hespellia sp.]
MSKFHEYLRLIRMTREYTQTQMAEKLGIPRSTYSNYEAGKRSPDLDTLEAICDVLDCSMDELFGRIGNGNIIREEPVVYKVKKKEAARVPRIVDEKYLRETPGKRMGIGKQNFRRLREDGNYYVDKTLMIQEFLESGEDVSLVTRPRRFGKTLNMSMLAEFLDCTKDSIDIFTDTRIAETRYMEECNQHPVIFLSFLNVKASSAKALLMQLYDVIRCEYLRYDSIILSDKLSEERKESIREILDVLKKRDVSLDEAEPIATKAIVELCQALEEYYGKKVYLFIDEYDTPFITANRGGYYDQVRTFLSVLLSSALKGNDALNKAMLTGIQRVAKENIFSGLNNITVCTVKDKPYASCFGFTSEETKQLLEYSGMKLTKEVQEMYDGYQFGNVWMYNPWSVTCYVSRQELEPYWVNTSENSMIEQAMDDCGVSFRKEYDKLVERGNVSVSVELGNSFYEQPGKDALWGMLINAGMVTIEKVIEHDYFTVRIPNKEVALAFRKLTAHSLQVPHDAMFAVVRYLRMGEMEDFIDEYQHILLTLPSYHDLKDENSYHMMMLGMCSYLYGEYEVRSNRESGKGRSDILLKPLKPCNPEIVLEFKYTKDENEDLVVLAQQVLHQIKEKRYDAELEGKIYHIGIAHCGKKAEIAYEI